MPTEQEKAAISTARFGDVGQYLLAMARSYAPLLWLLTLLSLTVTQLNSSRRMRDYLQDQFAALSKDLARIAVDETVDDWLTAFERAIQGYLVAQLVVAKGRTLLPTELLRLKRTVMRAQLHYAFRFAGDIREQQSSGHTEDEIARYVENRSRLYSGAGRALWFRAVEEDLPIGWVVDYHARDDAGTCFPCSQAQAGSPYLPGEGPYPGEVCLGRGNCRCDRVARFDPEAFRELNGESPS